MSTGKGQMGPELRAKLDAENAEAERESANRDISGKFAYLSSGNGRALVEIEHGYITYADLEIVLIDHGKVLLGEFRFPAALPAKDVKLHSIMRDAYGDYRESVYRTLAGLRDEVMKYELIIRASDEFIKNMEAKSADHPDA